MRVCQFRHDGILNCKAAAAAKPPSQEDLHSYFTALSPPVKPTLQLARSHPYAATPSHPTVIPVIAHRPPERESFYLILRALSPS
jgi:hypothetical protein